MNAGHNPPYLLRSGAEIEKLPTGGTVIADATQYDDLTFIVMMVH